MTTFYIQGTSSLRSTVAATSTAGATIKKPTRWSVGLNSSLVRTSGLYAESNATYPAINYINFSDLTALVAPGVLSSLGASAFLNFF